MLNKCDLIQSEVVGRREELTLILASLAAGKHLLLEGPPGTSKSTLLRAITGKAGLPLYIVEGSIDMAPAKLIGHFNPGRVLADSYNPRFFEKGPLVRAMEEGGVLYIEEFNRMPADVSNVLISPMEEGELHIPRYGVVRARRGFTVVAAQNPYDDVGTVRVSRAFLDRITRVRMDYQSETEEAEIVRRKTGCTDRRLVEWAVAITRKTRQHPEVRLGASVRAAIDIVEIALRLPPSRPLRRGLLDVVLMALSGKIWLSELSSRTTDAVVEEIYRSLRQEFVDVVGHLPDRSADSPRREDHDEPSSDQKKKRLVQRDRADGIQGSWNFTTDCIPAGHVF